MKVLRILLVILGVILLATCSAPHKIFITGHRGASGVAPENTMSSYLLALEMGADFGELDVQETADDVLILFHDKTYERTAGIEANVWELPYDSIRTFDVGSWKSEAYQGEPIPLFTGIIDSVQGRMKLNIEIKMNGHQDGLTEHVVQVVHDKHFGDQCILTSFDFDAVNLVRSLDPSLKVGYIFSKMPTDVDIHAADVDLFSVKNKLATADFVKRAHAAGKEVHVWGKVDKPEEMVRLRDLGIDNVITNHPDKWREFLER